MCWSCHDRLHRVDAFDPRIPYTFVTGDESVAAQDNSPIIYLMSGNPLSVASYASRTALLRGHERNYRHRCLTAPAG